MLLDCNERTCDCFAESMIRNDKEAYVYIDKKTGLLMSGSNLPMKVQPCGIYHN